MGTPVFVCDGIEVRGGPEFRARTVGALALLRDSPHFALVRPYLRVIREAAYSGMWANCRRPTFNVGARTWHSPAL